MEIIIFIAVVVGAVLLWNGYVKAKKTDSDQAIDNWQPPKAEDKPWPYGEKLPEGKIHVKVADVAPTAPTDSEDRVETPAPAPALAVDGHGDVHEVKPAKKAPAKKTAAKPAAAKKAPAKKKST